MNTDINWKHVWHTGLRFGIPLGLAVAVWLIFRKEGLL
jgi:hypothetical protein